MTAWHVWKNAYNVLTATPTSFETRFTGLPRSCTFSHTIFLSLSTSSIALHKRYQELLLLLYFCEPFKQAMRQIHLDN